MTQYERDTETIDLLMKLFDDKVKENERLKQTIDRIETSLDPFMVTTPTTKLCEL